MKCLLHIGTHKTGTTLLQNWLYSNQEELLRQGVCLSNEIGCPNNWIFAKIFSGRFPEKEKKWLYSLEAFKAEVSRIGNDHDVFVITSEFFSSLLSTKVEIRELANFLSDFFTSVEVVCYFRNQYDRVLSGYSEYVKSGTEKSLDQEIAGIVPEACTLNYLHLAENWSAVFGERNCLFRIYDRHRFRKGSICYEFLDILNLAHIDEEKLDFSIDFSNESVTALQAAAFRAVNRHVPFRDPSTGLKNPANLALKKSLQNVQSLNQVELKSDKRVEVESLFAESNEEFFRNYFGCPNQFISKNGDPEAPIMLASEEVEKIVHGVLESVLQEVFPQKRLFDSDATALGGIADKILRKRDLMLRDVLELMKLAQRARPNGKNIKRRIDQIEGTLSLKRSDYIPPLWSIENQLFDSDATSLGEIADKILDKKELDTDDALSLMRLASRARPAGTNIKRKIRLLEEQLGKLPNDI